MIWKSMSLLVCASTDLRWGVGLSGVINNKKPFLRETHQSERFGRGSITRQRSHW